MKRVAIIGAGMTGLTLACRLRSSAEVTVFEKSRGFGGRMATRHREPYQFDHGAQFFTAKTESFQRFLQPFVEQGHVARWDARFVEIDSDRIICERDWVDGPAHYVGAPGMNALPKQMAGELDVRLETHIDGITRDGDCWHLRDNRQQDHGEFDWLLLAIPALQAAALLPGEAVVQDVTRERKMLGCYSLMLGFAEPPPLAWQAAFVSNADISWVSNDNSKPGRPSAYSLLVHSTNRWAEANIEADQSWVRDYLLEQTERVIGHQLSGADHLGLHRWRYANIARQKGDSCLIDTDRGLALAGDWFVHGRIESAYLSARALAQQLLARL